MYFSIPAKFNSKVKMAKKPKPERDRPRSGVMERSFLNSANTENRISGMVIAPRMQAVPQDFSVDDYAYNFVYAAWGEKNIPIPRIPTTYGQGTRCATVDGVYHGSYTLLPGHYAYILPNPHGGTVNTTDWSPGQIAALQATVTDDFIIVDYDSGALALSDVSLTDSWDTVEQLGTDFMGDVHRVISAIPATTGVNPRDLLRGGWNAGYSLLSASMEVEVATNYGGSATVYAVDMNQNARNWGGIAFDWDGSRVNRSEDTVGDGRYGAFLTPTIYANPMYANGRIRIYGPTLGYGSVTNPVSYLPLAHRKVAIGGNDRAYTWSQIPSDTDFMCTCGCPTYTGDAGADYDHTACVGANGCFPVKNLSTIVYSAKAFSVVQNTSADTNLNFTVNATATFASQVMGDSAYFLNAAPLPMHIVPNMDFMATSTCGTNREQVIFDAKKTMYDKLAQRGVGPIFQALAASAPKLSLPSSAGGQVRIPTGVQWTREVGSVLLKILGLSKSAGGYLLSKAYNYIA